MAERRVGQPRSIRELVGDLTNRADLRYGARRLDASDALREALGQVAGADVADRCRIESILGTEARIACRDNSTAMRVRFYVPDILIAARARLAADDVTAIRVSVSVQDWDEA